MFVNPFAKTAPKTLAVTNRAIMNSYLEHVYFADWAYAPHASRNLKIRKASREGDVETLRSMVQQHPKLASTEPDLLHHACMYGHLDVVKLLIKELRWNPQRKADSVSIKLEPYQVFTRDDWKKKDTPLHVACRYGHIKIVRYLTEEEHCSQTILNITTGEKPLHIACYHRDLELVKLVSNCDVNAKTKCRIHNPDGHVLAEECDTPLHIACRYGNLEIVRYLRKEKHCKTNICNAAGELPLHIACGTYQSLTSWAQLHCTVTKSLDIVKLVSDCNVNTQTWLDKDTPLHMACRQNNLKIARYLCKEKHCDTNIPNAAGELPLHIACDRSQSDRQTLDIVKLVSDCNVNTQRRRDQSTPLHIACHHMRIDVAKYLVYDKHCDVHVKDHNGEQPLHIAYRLIKDHVEFWYEGVELVVMLINEGSDTKVLLHLLHWACRHGELDIIVKLLVEKQDWDPIAQCRASSMSWELEKGDTLLHVACRYGYTVQIVKYLTEHCDPTVRNRSGELPLHIACTHKSLEMVKLVSNCDVNAKTSHTGNTPLHIACERRNIETVKYLVEERHCDTTVRNSNGQLPLHIACADNSLEVVKLVSKFGRSQSDKQTLRITKIYVNAQTWRDKSTPLHIACRHMQLDIAKYLVDVKHCDVNVKDHSGEQPLDIAYRLIKEVKLRYEGVELVLLLINEGSDTKVLPDLLHWACRHGELDIVKLLVEEQDWDPNVHCQAISMSCGCEFQKGDTLLHVACKYACCYTVKIVKYLTEHCDPTVRNSNGELPLHLACAYKPLEVMKLVSNCDVNAKTSHTGNTPLHIACKRGSAEIVKYLVEERRCDTTVRNGNGELPLHIACTHKSLVVVKLVSKCDLNAKTHHTGNTPLHIACERRNIETVKYLVEERHCDTTVRNGNGELPLHIACTHKSLEVVKLVSKCDLNAKTHHTGNTPLHIACERRNIETVKYLVEERHCDTTVRNGNGELPLHIACTHKSLEVVKLVSNCDVNAKTSHTGNTPLHIACERRTIETVKYLVETRCCDTTVRNSNGQLPLHIACADDSLEVVKLVSKFGRSQSDKQTSLLELQMSTHKHGLRNPHPCT